MIRAVAGKRDSVDGKSQRHGAGEVGVEVGLFGAGLRVAGDPFAGVNRNARRERLSIAIAGHPYELNSWMGRSRSPRSHSSSR